MAKTGVSTISFKRHYNRAYCPCRYDPERPVESYQRCTSQSAYKIKQFPKSTCECGRSWKKSLKNQDKLWEGIEPPSWGPQGGRSRSPGGNKAGSADSDGFDLSKAEQKKLRQKKKRDARKRSRDSSAGSVSSVDTDSGGSTRAGARPSSAGVVKVSYEAKLAELLKGKNAKDAAVVSQAMSEAEDFVAKQDEPEAPFDPFGEYKAEYITDAQFGILVKKEEELGNAVQAKAKSWHRCQKALERASDAYDAKLDAHMVVENLLDKHRDRRRLPTRAPAPPRDNPSADITVDFSEKVKALNEAYLTEEEAAKCTEEEVAEVANWKGERSARVAGLQLELNTLLSNEEANQGLKSKLRGRRGLDSAPGTPTNNQARKKGPGTNQSDMPVPSEAGSDFEMEDGEEATVSQSSDEPPKPKKNVVVTDKTPEQLEVERRTFQNARERDAETKRRKALRSQVLRAKGDIVSPVKETAPVPKGVAMAVVPPKAGLPKGRPGNRVASKNGSPAVSKTAGAAN